MSASTPDSVLGTGTHGNAKITVNLSWRRKDILMTDPPKGNGKERFLCGWKEKSHLSPSKKEQLSPSTVAKNLCFPSLR